MEVVSAILPEKSRLLRFKKAITRRLPFRVRRPLRIAFVAVDVIGRNGLKMWPETFKVLKQLWAILPDKYKVTHTRYAVPRFVRSITNHDYSEGSFEAVRSQDVLPLFTGFFDPNIYVPFHSICRYLLDTQYGPNYDLNDPLDRATIEFIWDLDCHYIRERILPPGTMFALMKRKGRGDPRVVAETATRMLADSRSRRAQSPVSPISRLLRFSKAWDS